MKSTSGVWVMISQDNFQSVLQFMLYTAWTVGGSVRKKKTERRRMFPVHLWVHVGSDYPNNTKSWQRKEHKEPVKLHWRRHRNSSSAADRSSSPGRRTQRGSAGGTCWPAWPSERLWSACVSLHVCSVHALLDKIYSDHLISVCWNLSWGGLNTIIIIIWVIIMLWLSSSTTVS